jgi:organic radical activating enzyme
MLSPNKLPLAEDFYTLQGEGAYSGTAAWFIRLGGCDVGCPWCDAKESWNPRACPPVEVDEIVRRAAANPAKTVVITGGEPLMHQLDTLTDALHAENLKVHLETSGTHPFTGRFDHICLSPKKHRPPLDDAWHRADELKVIIATPEDLQWAEQCKSALADNSEGFNPRLKGNSSDSLAPSASPHQPAADLRAPVAELAIARLPSASADGQKPPPLLFLQPEWSRRDEITPLIIAHIKQNPRWRISLQTHKYMQIP